MNKKLFLTIILLLLLSTMIGASRNNYVIIDTPMFGFSATIINGSGNGSNNYVTNSLFTRSGSIITLTLERLGLSNLTSNFTDQTGGGKWSIDNVTLKNDSGVLTGNYTNSDGGLSFTDNVVDVVVAFFTDLFYEKDEVYNKTESNLTFVNVDGDTMTGNLTVNNNVSVKGFISGQPIDGSIGSGIISAESFDVNANLNVTRLNATRDGGLGVNYPSFIMRLVTTGNLIKYCSIPGANLNVTDDAHTVYYIDNNCAIQSTPIASYLTTSISPGGLADFFNVLAHTGSIEIIDGTNILNKENIKDRLQNFYTHHLRIISGMSISTDTFPNYNQSSGQYFFDRTVVDATAQNSIDGVELVNYGGGNPTYINVIGINLTSCDNGTHIVTCGTNLFYRYIIFTIGYIDGEDTTELHQLTPIDGSSFPNLASCLDIGSTPITYTLPAVYDNAAVVTYAYCGRRDDSSWSGEFIDLRETTGVGGGANPDLSIYALAGDCPSGEFVQNATNGGVQCKLAGDITAVNTNGEYLTGGAATGAVSLLLDETVLNATIDARSINEYETGGWTNTSDNTTTLLNVGIGTITPRMQLEVMNGALYLSNTSVAHGITDVIPTDVYGNFEIINANGGIKIRGFSETGLAFFQLGYVTTSYTTETAGALGAIGYSIYKKDGTAGGYMDDDDNMVVFRNGDLTKHIFKGNGDLYAFGGISRNAHFWGVRITEYNTVNTNFNILTYDNVYLEDSDFYSESGGTITIQRSGWYEASANCQSDLDGGTREDAQCAIYVNSAQLHECGMYAREIGVLGTGCTESVMLNLTATDTVSVRFRGGATDVDCGDGSADCMTFRMEYVRDN